MKGEPLVRMDGWCLVDPKHISDEKKRLINGEDFASFMWHECEALKFEYRDEEAEETECEIRYLDSEDSLIGKCWYCMMQAPHDLHTLWMIHNMDIIHNMPDPLKNSWETDYLKSRIKDIEVSKENGRKAGWYNG